ncbi:MAG: hypothetical protein ACR2IG_17135 [Roseomonas sp.]
MMRIFLSGFIAGALSVVIFHQGSAFLLYHIGNDIPAVVAVFGKAAAPFNMAPTKPLGVPAIASQCFWGGVWGVVLAFILSRRVFPALAFGAIFGALALTVVAVTLVPYLKGLPGWNGAIPWRGLLYNGAWGFGAALLLLKPLSLRV